LLEEGAQAKIRFAKYKKRQSSKLFRNVCRNMMSSRYERAFCRVIYFGTNGQRHKIWRFNFSSGIKVFTGVS
jgi:hypothetical protein